MNRTPRRVSFVQTLAVCAGALILAPTSAAAQTEIVEYYASDAVGSVRVVFGPSGSVLGRMDYGPFGAELYTGVLMPGERFADLNRDGESGLDYARARMYRPETGRFNSPDRVFALVNPQSLNRYSYSLNNPTTYTDSTGPFSRTHLFHLLLYPQRVRNSHWHGARPGRNSGWWA